jgi:hypothetical protein
LVGDGKDYFLEIRGDEGTMKYIYTVLSKLKDVYNKTRMYRDFKSGCCSVLRGAVQLLKGEKIVREEKNVVNMKEKEGWDGTMVITNLRVVWFKNGMEKNNASIPFFCLDTVGEAEMFGERLLKIRCMEYSWREEKGKKKGTMEGLWSRLFLSLSFPPI